MTDSKTAQKIEVQRCKLHAPNFEVTINGRHEWCGAEAEAQAKKMELEASHISVDVYRRDEPAAAQPTETRPPQLQMCSDPDCHKDSHVKGSPGCVDAAARVEQPTPPSDGRRYRRLRILGCAPDGSRQLEQGTVLRFTNLDEFLDRSIASQSSLGEAVETCSATCPVCCNIEGATQHRPMTDAEAEHYETAPAAPVVAQREDEISKLVDAIVEIVHGCDPRKEETQLRTWLTRRLTNLATGKTYSEETK